MSATAGKGTDSGVQPSLPPDQPARALVLALHDGAALLTSGGEVIFSNDRFEGLPESVKAEVGVAVRALAARRPDRRQPQAIFDALFEIEAAGPAWFEVRIRATGAGQTVPFAAIVRDVSAEHRREGVVGAIDRAGADLLRFDAQQVREKNAQQRLQLLEERIVKHLSEILHFESFSIWLLDERTGRLECIIRKGLPAEVADLELYSGREGNGITGHVAATGASYLCEDAESDPLFIVGATGAKCSLTVPLKLGDRVIGILDAESTKPHAFTDEDRRFAEEFARYIATALHMLDLLVVERSATSMSACGRVEGEIKEPLDDILLETDQILARAETLDEETRSHVTRIRADVDAIRRRLSDVASGPQTLLGVERAMARREIDPVLRGKRILVADDEARIRRVLGDVLRHRGCEVAVCENGAEAIEQVEASAATPFDLVISDIKMPDRNGYEVFSVVKRVMTGTPVILMTGFGYDPHHSIVRASQEGLHAVLFKPFQIERMIDEVRRALAAKV